MQRFNIFSISIIIVMSGAMLYLTGLIPAMGEWYSFDQSFRLQTSAFMRGELALQPVPYYHRHDWVWGNGLQQVWGLGVPLIQLPFEIAARCAGLFGFPDRIIFLIFYLLVAAIFWTSLNSTRSPLLNFRERLQKQIHFLPILFFALLNPALITMMRAGFGPYEEVIAYGYMWAFLLFALMCIFLRNRQPYLYLLTCLLAGFSPNIRPTTGIYGITTFLLIFYIANRSKLRFRWLGLPLFLVGLIFLTVTNYLRFGSPIEFGHKLLLAVNPTLLYILKFDNPMKYVSLWDKTLELLSALFFIDNYGLFMHEKGLLWQSSVPRWREFNFTPYGPFTLLGLLLSWFIIAISFMRWERKYFNGNETLSIIKTTGIWASCSFIMLFFFYLNTPAIVSRYMVDFGPSIVVAIAILYLFVIKLIDNKLYYKFSSSLIIGLSLTFLGLIFVGIRGSKLERLYQANSTAEQFNVTSLPIARNNLNKWRSTKGPSLPASYSCGDIETNYDIPYNHIGWDISNTCDVALASMHFFDNPTCIALHIEPIEGIPNLDIQRYNDNDIKVKKGLERMQRVSESILGQGKIITYCSSKEKASNNYGNIELISIAWGNLQKNPDAPVPPYRLISLKKVQ